METAMCAADVFMYEEDAAVTLDKFYSVYRHQFPVLAVIVDGHQDDGVPSESFDNEQVFRVQGYTSQPRVACTDSRGATVTLPRNCRYGFHRVQANKQLGSVQTLESILGEAGSLPVLVTPASETGTREMRAFRPWTIHTGQLVVKLQYDEHYLMVNCIDGTDTKMNSTSCLMALSPKLTATPVTGFKYKSKDEFEAYLRKLDNQVATGGGVYDKTLGNPDVSVYEPHQELPAALSKLMLQEALSSKSTSSAEKEGNYIPMEPPPRPPPKKPGIPPSIQPKRSYPPSDPAPKPPDLSTCPTSSNRVNYNIVPTKPRRRGSDTTNDDITAACAPIPVPRKPTHHGSGSDTPPPSPDTAPPLPPRPQNLSASYTVGKLPDRSCAAPYAAVKPMPRATVPAPPRDRPPQPYPHAPLHATGPTYAPLQAVDTAGGEYAEPDEYEDLCVYSHDEDSTSGAEDDGGSASSMKKVHPRSDTAHSTKTSAISSADSAKTDRVETVPDAGDAHGKQSVSDSGGTSQREVGQGEPAHVDITSLTISDVSRTLDELGLGMYSKTFRLNKVDGCLLAELTVEDLVHELDMRKLEAIRLRTYLDTGHVPK